MRTRNFLGVVLPLALAATAVNAEEAYPSAFSCEFTGGIAGSYAAGAFASKPPSPLSFLIVDIDLAKQSGRIVTGPTGVSGSLRLVRALNANHFLEVANEGFLNLTTIFDKDPATGLNPAVHSRHLGVLGQPVFAQYTGFCTAR
jgi:hypothetical protein